MDKLVSLDYALELVKSGSTVAFGGNVLYRSPVKVAAGLALNRLQNLHLVKTAIALEADILCGAGCVASVTAGFVGYETQFGLCHFYRQAVEQGQVQAQENACYSVITAFRAAAQGVPFLPIRGMLGSELMSAVGFKTVEDPYSGEELCAVQAIRPDVAFIHVHRADCRGNAEIIGPMYEDLLVAQSARKVVLTCEEMVAPHYFGPARKAHIPEVLTSCVVHLPKGAAPGECDGFYETDTQRLTAFKKLETQAQLLEFLQKEVL